MDDNINTSCKQASTLFIRGNNSAPIYSTEDTLECTVLLKG